MRPHTPISAQALAHNSFENNLQQLNKANRLLSSIERKLTDYSQDDPQTTPLSNKNPINAYQGEMSRPRNSQIPERDRNISNIHAGMVTPNTDKEFLQYLSPGEDSKRSRPNSKIGGSSMFQGESRQQEYPPTISKSFNYQTNRDTVLQSYEKRGYTGLMDNNFATPQSQSVQSLSRNGSKARVRSPSKEFLAGLGIQVDTREGDRKMSGHILVETMNKVEDFYENKVKLLEEKLNSSEAEVQMLKQFQNKLHNELRQLQGSVVDERRRSSQLRDQNDRDIEGTGSIDAIKLRKQMDELAKRYEIGIKDNETLKKQYDELMRLHNQMIEMDMHKNEKNLNIEQNTYRQGYDDRSPSKTWYEGEKVEDLVGIINSYKNELNLLTVKNNRAQWEMEAEIQRLKDEVRAQKKENKKLKTTTTVGEKSPLLKSPSSKKKLTTMESSAKKKKREKSEKSEKAEKKMTKSRSKSKLEKLEKLERIERIEKENIEALSPNKLAKYTKDLQDEYKSLEGEHQQQMRYNEGLHGEIRALRDIMRDQCAEFNETYSQVFEKSRHWAPVVASPERVRGGTINELRSADRVRSPPHDENRRHILKLALKKDLAEIPVMDRAMSPRDVSSPRLRAKSKTMKSPVKGKEKDLKKTASGKDLDEFKREMNSLKDMLNQKAKISSPKPRRRSGEFRRKGELYEDKLEERLNVTANVTKKKTSGQKSKRKMRF